MLAPLLPTDATVPYEIGQLYYYKEAYDTIFDQNNYDSAILYYEKAVQLNAAVADYWTKAGDAYFDAAATPKYEGNLGFYQKAIEHYQKAISLDSTQFLAMNRLGVSYIYLDKYKEAIDVFEQALKKDILYKNTYEYNLACIYSLQKNNTKALDYFERSINSGYTDLAHISEDTDLDNIRSLPEFKAIVEKHFKADEIKKLPYLFKKKN
jgi:tetratricopeptide (TPR) repeat protein